MAFSIYLRKYQWECIKHSLPRKVGDVGVTAQENRYFAEGVIFGWGGTVVDGAHSFLYQRS